MIEDGFPSGGKHGMTVVTNNGTTVVNTTACVSSCSHTSLVLCNMTQQTDSLYGVGHRLNDEEDGELWRVSVS